MSAWLMSGRESGTRSFVIEASTNLSHRRDAEIAEEGLSNNGKAIFVIGSQGMPFAVPLSL
jgi:hypothetical protein